MSTQPDASLTDLIERARDLAPEDPKLRAYLAAIKSEAESIERRDRERDALLAEYEEAYHKLTSPANRIGTVVGHLEDERLLILLGDTEYVVLCDPKVERDTLTAGTRVALNEAYAVIGILPSSVGGSIVSVREVQEDGRLRISTDSQGSQGRLILRSHELAGAPIKAGDEVRLDSSGRIALEHFGKREVQDYFVEEVPEVPWAAVGGQEEAIQVIRESIELPLLHPELFSRFDKKPVKGILLYGPPGCGKTLLGKAIAYNLAKEYSERVGHEVKEYFMHISGPKILNMWLGETERMVREIFATARERAKEGRLVVIFMDEAESVLRTRSSGRWLNISNTVVPQFCAELDGLVSLENVILILTTNRPDYIDPAILRPERIDRKVKIRRPDRESSRTILGIYLHDRLPIDPEVIDEHDGEISCARRALIEASMAHIWRTAPETEFLKVLLKNGSSETLGYKDLLSGALLKSIVDRAKDTAIRRAIQEPEVAHGIRIEDLTGAIDAEFKENEIFPKTDTLDDWLKLLDIEPERVAAVRPIGQRAGEEFVQREII